MPTPKNHGDFKHLGFDSFGVKEDFHYDEDTGQVTIARTFVGDENPQHVVEQNKKFQNSGESGYSSDKTFKHVAAIPLAVVELWINQYGVDPTKKENRKLLARLLNSNEWKWLRTGGGHLEFRG